MEHAESHSETDTCATCHHPHRTHYLQLAFRIEGAVETVPCIWPRCECENYQP